MWLRVRVCRLARSSRPHDSSSCCCSCSCYSSSYLLNAVVSPTTPPLMMMMMVPPSLVVVVMALAILGGLLLLSVSRCEYLSRLLFFRREGEGVKEGGGACGNVREKRR